MVERLAVYFLEETTDRCKWAFRQDLEADLSGWENIVTMQGFSAFYGGISGKGIFAHNSQHLYSAEAAEAAKRLGVFSPATQHIYDLDGTASYYLVAIPERPLHLTDLPE